MKKRLFGNPPKSLVFWSQDRRAMLIMDGSGVFGNRSV
jgi:hypothetical protein